MPTTRQWGIQNSVFRTPVHCFFSRLFKGSKKKTWFELSRVKLYRIDLRGNKNYFELAGGSSYRGLNYSKCTTEIQGKSVLVRVSARFELAGSSYRESNV